MSEADLQALVQDFRRRRVSGDELEEIRLRITRLYVARGFVNSGAVIAPEARRDGVFSFRIVEGRIGDVQVTGQARRCAWCRLAPCWMATASRSRSLQS